MIGNFSYIPKVFCYWFMFLNICFWFFRLFFFPCRCVDKLFVEEENWESAVAEWEWACQRCAHSASTEDVWSNCSWMKRAGRVLWLFGRELVNPVHIDSTEDVWTNSLQRKRSGRVLCLYERELCQPCAQWQQWRFVDKLFTEEENREGIAIVWNSALSALCITPALKTLFSYLQRQASGWYSGCTGVSMSTLCAVIALKTWTNCLWIGVGEVRG